MKGIYMDNGATSFPKAPGVAEAMANYITNVGCNVGRGAYEDAFAAQRIVLETRELLCELFNCDKVENVVFTKNITESLNAIMKGLLKAGDHVIISSMEHNAVTRPLNSLSKKGVEFSRAKCFPDGQLDLESVRSLIKENTKAIIMMHASNVCGTVLDLEGVGRIAREHGIFFIVDAAQTAGVLDVDMKKLNADAIAFTGHKSLLGPPGMGGFVINDRLCEQVEPFIEGGTGSTSESEEQPHFMPDKFESGTQNIVGIYGLNASLKFLKEKGIENIREHELEMTREFIKRVKDLPGVKLAGKETGEGRLAVVSIDFEGSDNAEIGFVLEHEYHISTRVGLHCAPSAHKTLGTFPQGTVRFSFGYATTLEQVEYAADAIKRTLESME